MVGDFNINKCLFSEVINAVGKMEVEMEQERNNGRNDVAMRPRQAEFCAR
jgi:hypothetical protein